MYIISLGEFITSSPVKSLVKELRDRADVVGFIHGQSYIAHLKSYLRTTAHNEATGA